MHRLKPSACVCTPRTGCVWGVGWGGVVVVWGGGGGGGQGLVVPCMHRGSFCSKDGHPWVLPGPREPAHRSAGCARGGGARLEVLFVGPPTTTSHQAWSPSLSQRTAL